MVAAVVSEASDLRAWKRLRRRRFSVWAARLIAFDPPPVEVAEHWDLIDAARRGCAIEPFDGDMPQPDSDDSYNHFTWEHFPLLHLSKEEAAAQRQRRSEGQHRYHATRAAKLQVEWEAQRRQRQLAKEAAASRQWEAEERRRKYRGEAERLAQEQTAAEEEIRLRWALADKWRAIEAWQMRQRAREQKAWERQLLRRRELEEQAQRLIEAQRKRDEACDAFRAGPGGHCLCCGHFMRYHLWVGA
jgi:hypothetical protein